MLAAGVKKEYRDTILGHSLKGMDRHYLVPSKDDLKDAMDQYTEWLDDQIEAVWKKVDHFVDHATKKGLKMLVKSLKSLVPPAGIGPAAHGLGIHCSIH